MTTRLSGIHPYPAMVPDDLASWLADEFVGHGVQMIDPFCGSGRLITAAAEKGAVCLGADVNPLACLITAAKVAPADLSRLQLFRRRLKVRQSQTDSRPRVGESVNWFSSYAWNELLGLIDLINDENFAYPDKLVVATALSAAAREASYGRTDSWKLHRLSEEARRRHRVSPATAFGRRLDYYLTEARNLQPFNGKVSLICGDLVTLSEERIPRADIVLTSPPYGDSRSTLQYGAASALCLDVVSRIEGLERLFVAGRDIDKRCLGACTHVGKPAEPAFLPSAYWGGSPSRAEYRKLRSFLVDFDRALASLVRALKPGGQTVLILGERSLGGFRVRLSRFAIERLEARGLRLTLLKKRTFRAKRLPRYVNRYARATEKHTRERGLVKTMDHELVLAFESQSD